MADKIHREMERQALQGDFEAWLRTQLNRRRRGERPAFILSKFMTNEDQPGGAPWTDREGVVHASSWGAGSQLGALHHYLDDRAEVIADYQEDDYQGQMWALIQFKITEDLTIYVTWSDYFGSCGGCDSLEDENGYDYIKATLAEGNTRQFWTLEDIDDYMEGVSPEDWTWSNGAKHIRPMIEKLLAS